MARTLYDLAGAEPERRFSPFCWRTRLALAHKGLEVETVPWRFTETARLATLGSEKVPVLVDGDAVVADSWRVACWLEDTYPERPSLFGGLGGRAATRFVNDWTDTVLHAAVARIVLTDIHACLGPEDAAYFRASREARFGTTLEAVVADRPAHLAAFRAALQPLRTTLRAQPFLGGETPRYADYIVFGAFQWARSVSPVRLLEPDDPVHAWRDRLLDVHGGLARATPNHDPVEEAA